MSLLAFPGVANAPGPSMGPVAINYGHPLSQGLTGLWRFDNGAVAPNGDSIFQPNEIFGNPPAAGFQPNSWSRNSRGPAIGFTATNQGLNNLCGASSYLRSLMIPTDRITVLMVRRKTDTTLRSNVHFGVDGIGSTADVKAFAPYVDGKIYWDFGGATGDNRLESDVLTWGTEVDYLGFVAGARGMAIYRNGVQVAVKTPAVTRTDGGSFHLNGSGDVVDINFFAILNAEWLPTQMLEWMANPYALLQAPSPLRRFFAVAPARTGGVLTIDGVEVPHQAGSLRITETLNGRGTMSCNIVSMAGTYRPTGNKRVVFTWYGTRLFAGTTLQPDEEGHRTISQANIVTKLQSVSFHELASRREVGLTITSGTLRHAAEVLVDYLVHYGVSLDPSMPAGPALDEIVLEEGPLDGHFDTLSTMTNWSWEIDYNLVFRFVEPGSVAAPFDITDNDRKVIGDLKTSQSFADHRNYVLVRFTTPAVAAYAFFTLTDVPSEDETVTVGSEVYTFKASPSGPNEVQIGGSADASVDNLIAAIYPAHDEVVASEQVAGTARVTAQDAGVSGNGIQVATTCADGAWTTEGGGTVSHLNLGSDDVLTGEAIAQDIPDQNGGENLKTITYRHPEITEQANADALAEGYLERHMADPTKVGPYETRELGIHPGMAQHIQKTKRNLDDDCLITDVEIYSIGKRLLRSRVTASTGLVIPKLELDDYKHARRLQQ